MTMARVSSLGELKERTVDPLFNPDVQSRSVSGRRSDDRRRRAAPVHGLFIGGLRGGVADAVGSQVDGRVNALVPAVDGGAQRLGVEVEFGVRGEVVEGAVEHANDLGRFVVDDRLLALVLEHGHGDAAALVGASHRVQLAQEAQAVKRLELVGREGPALLLVQVVVDGGVGDGALEPHERARTMSVRCAKGAAVHDVEAIAAVADFDH